LTQIMKMETDEIEIPKDMLSQVPRAKHLRVYALSKNTIALSFQPIDEWSKRALWQGEVRFRKTDGSIIIHLPPPLSSFYSITQDNITISTSQKTNTIQIDIE